MQRDNLPMLIQAIQQLANLRKLNVSNNDKINQSSMQQIIKALITNNSIEDFNLSRTGVNNDQQTMILLADLIAKNKSLRSLYMQRLNLTDTSLYHLIDPLSQSLNLETLNLDFNDVGSNFISNYVTKLLTNKRTENVYLNQTPLSQASSLMTDETYSNADSYSKQPTPYSTSTRTQGLINLSLEGNEAISDDGAAAISDLIQSQNAFSNNLRVVNMNQCGITNTGFEHLKLALRQRATMANSLNLTHVKITIERNNIEQGE